MSLYHTPLLTGTASASENVSEDSNLNGQSTVEDQSWAAGLVSPSPRPLQPHTSPAITRDTLSPLPPTTSRLPVYSQRRTGSTDSNVTQGDGERSSTSSTFELPLRSLVASSQPTSLVSVNTAQASISSSNSTSTARPFAALSEAAQARRTPIRSADLTGPSGSIHAADRSIPGVEKDVDDPMSTLSPGVAVSRTSHAITTLFTSDSGPSASLSRRTTFGRSLSNGQRRSSDTATMEGHLYHVGFREGRHSDITVHAFGERYKLHKLVLDRVPFFSSAFSGAWAESSAEEMTLRPEELDPYITQMGFELALKRIYGTVIPAEEETDAIGLFATASWLNMPDLVDVCVDNILRQMLPENLHILIKLVTNSFYGKAGDRILSSAKAMLCRDGWEMPYQYWDDVPADIIREIIEGDPFYIPGEWERWYLALKILNRRLRRLAVADGLVTVDGRYLTSRPRRFGHAAIRPARSGRADQMTHSGSERWHQLYAHPEVSPLLQLLDTGIHYIHLRFEQLQVIRLQRDLLGVPVLPDSVVADALWMSMELRQKIMSAQESDMDLGLSETADEDDTEEDAMRMPLYLRSGKGAQPEVSDEGSDEQHPLRWHDANSETEPRRFWIPSTDVSCVLGGTNEPPTASSMATSPILTRRSQMPSASFEPADVVWPPDLGGSIFDSHSNRSRKVERHTSPSFTRYPPFRFCAEFPNPRTLKEKKRIYSQTVWYAGSMWNLYIQRMNTHKSQQLGIYLHRAKDKDNSEDPLALTVDDRIGQLERDMLLRKGERRYPQHSATAAHPPLESEHEERWLQGSDFTTDQCQPGMHGADSSTARSPKIHQTSASTDPSRHHHHPRTPSTSDAHDDHSGPSASTSEPKYLPFSDDPFFSLDSSYASSPNLDFRPTSSTIPPYTDNRTTIKTYFKIYSPSRGGKLLSVYESAPDDFIFGKSWGWKSSQLMLEDGIGPGSGHGGTGVGGSEGLVGHGTSGLGSGRDAGRDSKLRYMVVVGNV